MSLRSLLVRPRRRAPRRLRPRLLGASAALAAPALLLGGTAPATAAQPPVDQPAYVEQTPPLSTRWTAEVGPDNALPEYPRPQLTRERWQSLNGVWQFEQAADLTTGVPTGEDLPERVLVPYPVESALSGIQREVQRMWYRRTVEVPQDWRVGGERPVRPTAVGGGALGQGGNRLWLHFGAVDHDTVVYVNGQQATTHRGGYDAFSVDVTPYLTRSGPQEVIVGVEDLTDATGQPVGKQREGAKGGIFYTPSSGIWQSVWMEPKPTSSIERLDTTPDLATSSLGLTVRATGSALQRVRAVAVDRATGAEVGRVEGRANAPLSLPVPGARLWSPDSPTLYDLRVRLLDRDGRGLDTVGSYFGMRSVGIMEGEDGRNHIALNGKILFNNAVLDQGFWPDGIYTAPTDQALASDLVLAKRLGFNTVRKHIKVEPDRWYYHADTLGMLVWQDMPAMRLDPLPDAAAQAQFEAELHTMVEQHRSWTSIVAWVPFNEGWGEWSSQATGRIAASVKEQDPSRLVDAHSGVNCCLSKGDSGQGDIVDFHQYVGPASPRPDAARVASDGEHGGLGLRTPGHEWFTDGTSFAYEITDSSKELTDRYVQVADDLKGVAATCGLSGSVYTQTSDVEAEINGFVTYDRAVEKMDVDRVRAVNQEVTASADGRRPPALDTGPGTPGLTGVGSWPADEGSGAVAADQVGDADLTLRGGAGWTAGVSGSALAFDGVDDQATTAGPVLDTTGSYSVAAWVRLDADTGFATAVGQDGDDLSTFFLQRSGADGRFAFSAAGGRALSDDEPEVGRWYHLVGVRDVATSTYTLYVDGKRQGAQGSFSACAPGEASTGPLTVGRAKFGGQPVDFWPGAVDQVHAYDRALNAQEVADLYASGR